jgi:hypothetical protein
MKEENYETSVLQKLTFAFAVVVTIFLASLTVYIPVITYNAIKTYFESK